MKVCSEPGCDAELSRRRDALRCIPHHLVHVRQQIRVRDEKIKDTPFREWIDTAEVSDRLSPLVEFIQVDGDWPAETKSLYEIRRYVQRYSVPAFVEGGLAELWSLYCTSILPEAEEGELVCADCHGPRGSRSEKWCKRCAGRHAAIATRASEAAIKRGEKRREDKLLADKMRRIIAKEGWNIEDIIWSEDFRNRHGSIRKEFVH